MPFNTRRNYYGLNQALKDLQEKELNRLKKLTICPGNSFQNLQVKMLKYKSFYRQT